MPAQDPRQLDPSKLDAAGKEMVILLNKPRTREQLNFTNLEELEDLAKSILPHMVHRYFAGGADGEVTLRESLAVWKSYRLLPRMLRDVSHVDTSTTLLGDRVALPVGIAPMASMKMAHPEGELAVARAAEQACVPMLVSTNGSTHLSEVRSSAPGCPAMMFQLYVYTGRKSTVRLIQEAETAGYKALCLTVDVPALSNREDDIKNNFKLPSHLNLLNIPDIEEADRQLKARSTSTKLKQMGEWHDATLTWDCISWIKSQTTLPVFVKGILDPRDATKAVQMGCDGIIVSNHGGRQLDSATNGLHMLPSIAKAVNKRVPLWLDGGVRRGTDIVKALALGADGVLIGRPIMYALALDGQRGVQRALDIIGNEFRLSMQLMGCTSVTELQRSQLLGPWDHAAKL